ncbi:soluble scavenger receptor cysteine-rich domain-containing protein SSC5D-like isoform X3 [Sycon ciliatum]|uniref:soluble scavenger receptor cysteine-rich domain-containing protein SSC5D-like isoform X3 n=1 Tax=Sycon ciliatum TaxID=27933 RepID=UPI0031F62B65|eukprot:scpid68909/ scgid5348/ 
MDCRSWNALSLVSAVLWIVCLPSISNATTPAGPSTTTASCASLTCYNGAYCYIFFGTPTCSCTLFYYGIQCQYYAFASAATPTPSSTTEYTITTTGSCATQTCYHGACYLSYGTPTCGCKLFYYGYHCQYYAFAIATTPTPSSAPEIATTPTPSSAPETPDSSLSGSTIALICVCLIVILCIVIGVSCLIVRFSRKLSLNREYQLLMASDEEEQEDTVPEPTTTTPPTTTSHTVAPPSDPTFPGHTTCLERAAGTVPPPTQNPHDTADAMSHPDHNPHDTAGTVPHPAHNPYDTASTMSHAAHNPYCAAYTVPQPAHNPHHAAGMIPQPAYNPQNTVSAMYHPAHNPHDTMYTMPHPAAHDTHHTAGTTEQKGYLPGHMPAYTSGASMPGLASMAGFSADQAAAISETAPPAYEDSDPMPHCVKH